MAFRGCSGAPTHTAVAMAAAQRVASLVQLSLLCWRDINNQACKIKDRRGPVLTAAHFVARGCVCLELQQRCVSAWPEPEVSRVVGWDTLAT